MKLSKETMEILKNFASINANIYIKKGKSLSTLAIAKNIMASVDVAETFDKDFGIFNLSELLAVISLMDDPEIKLEDKYMTLIEGKSKMRYTYADQSILTYPQKAINMPDADAEFTLTQSHLNQILRASAALSVQDIAVIGDGKKIIIKVLDKKNDSSNQYTIDIGATTDAKFTVYFKVENFKHITDDYEVELSKKNISKFVGAKVGVTYFVAIEQDSTWED